MKRKLFRITLYEVDKVLFATSKEEALSFFKDAVKNIVSNVDDTYQLRRLLQEVLDNNYFVEELEYLEQEDKDEKIKQLELDNMKLKTELSYYKRELYKSTVTPLDNDF